jgi:hypothetical protein
VAGKSKPELHLTKGFPSLIFVKERSFLSYLTIIVLNQPSASSSVHQKQQPVCVNDRVPGLQHNN